MLQTVLNNNITQLSGTLTDAVPQVKELRKTAEKLDSQGGNQTIDQIMTSCPVAGSVEDTKNTLTQAAKGALEIPTDIVNKIDQKNTTIEHTTETLVTSAHPGMDDLVRSASGNPVRKLGDQMVNEAQVQYFRAMSAMGFPREQAEKHQEQLLTLLGPLLFVLGKVKESCYALSTFVGTLILKMILHRIVSFFDYQPLQVKDVINPAVLGVPSGDTVTQADDTRLLGATGR